jgi:ribosomal-protein-alanine N-acetyltransferase
MNLERESATAARWSQGQYENLFLPSHNQRSAYVAWVAEDESNPEIAGRLLLAFLVAHRVDTEWELQNIVVSERARRQGLASNLLNELLTVAQSERASHIFLEVRHSNESARALYRKLGFEEAGFRKGYYANPPEDAIIYRLNFVNKPSS